MAHRCRYGWLTPTRSIVVGPFRPYNHGVPVGVDGYDLNRATPPWLGVKGAGALGGFAFAIISLAPIVVAALFLAGLFGPVVLALFALASIAIAAATFAGDEGR